MISVPKWALVAVASGEAPAADVVDALMASRLPAWTSEVYGAESPVADAYAAAALALRDLCQWAERRYASDEHERVLAASLEEDDAAELGLRPSDVCPAYPRLSWGLACRIARGQSPRELAPELTSREAHLWCSDGAPDVVPWLREHLGVPIDVRSIPVVRWAAQCMADDRRGSLLSLDHPDSIDAADLEGGLGPRDVEARAIARAALAEHGVESGPPVPWRGRRLRGVRHLRRAYELAMEGRSQSHCVASYTGRVARGESYIFALRAGTHRATAEVSPEGRVVDIRAKANAAPSDVCVRLMDAQLRLWGLIS